MSYDDDVEKERMKEKVAIINSVIAHIDEALAKHLSRQKELDQEKYLISRKGISSGIDEALHGRAKSLAAKFLIEDKELAHVFNEYVLRSLKEDLLPELVAQKTQKKNDS